MSNKIRKAKYTCKLKKGYKKSVSVPIYSEWKMLTCKENLHMSRNLKPLFQHAICNYIIHYF